MISSDLVIPIILLANSILTGIAVWSFIDAVIDNCSTKKKYQEENKEVIKL